MLFERCYPKITDWLFDVSGQNIDLRFFPLYSYGFWVAAGFLTAAVVIGREMKAREKLGMFSYTEQIVKKGVMDYASIAIFAVIGYFLGFKFLSDFFSGISPVLIGAIGVILIGGGRFAYEWWQAKNTAPSEETIRIYPSDLVGDFVMICAIFGVLGAVLFNYLESPEAYDGFWSDPISYLFSGLSVYGGMICAGIALLVYCYVKKIHIPNMFDCLAYCFILANGLGRMGCQVSGDGDWGIVNPNPKPDFIPQFLWAANYPHNIADVGIQILGCTEPHCMVLPEAVYPTPIYEFLMCTAIFLILHLIRKRFYSMPGMLFFIFFVLIGIQRFSIEQIRDLGERNLYHIFNYGLKQAELISIILVISGIAGIIWTNFYYKMMAPKPEH
jgi:phosphatidylglycerol---prolipoprotein diacylglyceryl transferase